MSLTGTAISLTAANASDTVAPSDRSFVWVKTGGTNTVTVTITPPGTYFGQAFAVVSSGVIPINTDRLIGPLDPRLADPTTGLITIAFGGTLAGTTRGVVSM